MKNILNFNKDKKLKLILYAVGLGISIYLFGYIIGKGYNLYSK